MNIPEKQFKLQPDARNTGHYAVLEDAFEKIQFFSKLRSKNYIKQLQQCMKWVTYLKIDKGDTVFYKGAWPKEFYIIMKGQVSVLIPKDQEAILKEKEQDRQLAKLIDTKIQANTAKRKVTKSGQIRRSSMLQNIYGNNMTPLQKQIALNFARQQQGESRQLESKSNQSLQRKSTFKPHEVRSQVRRISLIQSFLPKPEQKQNIPIVDDDELLRISISEVENMLTIGDLYEPEMYYVDGVFKYKQVNVLYPGTQFGEVGLVLMQGRSATLVCTQTCEFAILTKESFDKIFLEIHQLKIMKKCQMIMSALNLSLEYNQMLSFGNCFRKVKLCLGSYLFLEGQKSLDVFVLKKGEVQMLLFSKDIQNEIKRLDLVERLQLLKQRKGFQQDIFIRLSNYGPGTMLGYQDVFLDRPRSVSLQVTSSEATFYVTDKCQFRIFLSELGQNDKKTIKDSIQQFDQLIQEKTDTQQKIKVFAKNSIYQSPVNPKAGCLRSEVSDIERYSQKVTANEASGRISERKVFETYGATITDKLGKLGVIIKQMPILKRMDNDAFIQAFDKNGIEKRIKKLRLRRKILSKGNKLSKDDEKQFLKNVQLPSTRDKIRLQKSISSGQYRAEKNRQTKQNKSWCVIYSQQQLEKSKYDIQNLSIILDEKGNYYSLQINIQVVPSQSPSSQKFKNFEHFTSPSSVYLANTYIQDKKVPITRNPSAVQKQSIDKIKARPYTAGTSRKNLRISTAEQATISSEKQILTSRTYDPRQKSSFSKQTPYSIITSARRITKPQAMISPISLMNLDFTQRPIFSVQTERAGNKILYSFRQLKVMNEDTLQNTKKDPQLRKMLCSSHNLFRFGNECTAKEKLIQKRFGQKQ